ncbi:hypothetical protein FHS20_001240 [Phyllobacterium endophyticum]|uniref:Uncharacterized protein n=1 Tax=Phyllobacterium endophyticum TaxID=1149773 RepID=A0A2P7AUM8_9HYPH|nr:hypothetical protein [Phyllobacterium endophyticum]PSH57918.1 hypothetical protein CU100_09520 [Phyllobacterium endophyticum]TYR44125.1 hypothetical protein FY050_02870 [Phyllobacterium endophyticum]
MGFALEECNRVFALHVRCVNCIRESVKEIFGGQGGPSDVDELIESGLIEQVRFECVHCESAIGQLVAITCESDC